MHELAITQALFKQVVEASKKRGLKRVDLVKIRLGKYASFVDESIEFYWQIIAKESIASSAKIMIKRVGDTIKCLACNYQLKKGEDKPDFCPKCNSFKMVIIGGDEMILEEIIGV